jgi:hypothetical protein
MKRELVSGLLAGLVVGAVNFAAIVFTVKSVVKAGEAPAGAVLATVLVYFLKVILIGSAVAALVIFRKYYSIKGFLIGFTLTLVLIATDAMISKATNPVLLDKLLL